MTIRVGIGGWDFPPWRETFYPPGWPQKRALEYASRALTAIEVNGTFYRSQTPATFAKWHDTAPDGFIFALKAPRYATARRVLGEAGKSIDKFVASGIEQLQGKLGPLLWQFAPTKRFEPADFEAFLKLLPPEIPGTNGSRALRHVLELRHDSFLHADFIALARRYRMAIVFSDADEYPSFADVTGADVTGDFVYVRLMRAQARLKSGYPASALDRWAARAQLWARDELPDDPPRIESEPSEKPGKKSPSREVFVFFINGAKARAPAAAQALIARLP